MSSKSNAPRGPGCQWLYLRVTVGLLNALFVLGVALVALLVTATASLKALNDNGEAHVAALGNAAAYRVAVFFKRPELQAGSVTRYADAETLTFPSKHSTASMTEAQRSAANIPVGGVELERLSNLEISSTMAFDMQLFGTTIWLGDGSRMIQFPIPQVKNALYIEKWWRDNVTDALTRETIMYDTVTELRINSSDPRYGIFMPSRENITFTDSRSPATFNVLAGLVNVGRNQPVKWTTPRFFHEVVPYRYVLCGHAMYNSTDLIGFTFSGVTIGNIAEVLNGVRTSPDAMALALDDEGYILGSSGGHETFNVTPYGGGVVGKGCTTTDVTRNTVPSDKRLISCMHHFSNSKVPIVRQIALGGHTTHNHGGATHLFKAKADGESYFVQAQGVTGVSLHASVVVIVPEKEILGNVQQTIVVASLITAACVVVAAAACFGLVWWLLWPLRGIAVRMGKAARLEEDPDPVAISPLAEIGDLQRAFVEMRDELDRIRSYVPQSLLRANDTTDDEPYDPLEASGNVPTTNPTSTRPSLKPTASDKIAKDNMTFNSVQDTDGRSRVSGDTVSSRTTSRRGGGRRDAAASKFTEALRRDSVSILCLNVCGFHRFFEQGGTTQRGAVTSLVDAVLQAALGERGVVESFHGDRFLVSFNAVKPAANHGTRATVAAMQVAEAAEGLGLAVTAGVATGTAQVGNMGTKGMMRFSIVGPVVAQAATLERLCKVYTSTTPAANKDDTPRQSQPVRCLVPQRLFQDLSTAVVTRTVDYVHLPQAKNPCLIAEVDHLLRAGADDEWMYQLNHPDRANPMATANAAWMAGASGDMAKAQALFAVLDERVERSPGDTLCRRAADCPRLRAIVSSRPEPRLLGEFYEKTLQHPTS